MTIQTLSLPESTSTDEFFDWAEARRETYELIDGVPVLRPPAQRSHARIVMNLLMALMGALDRAKFDVATGNFAIPTGPRSIRFADLLVETAGGPGHGRITETAVLIVEVLSPSTAAEDFGRKQREYTSLPTLDDYLIVSQDARRVWQWARDGSGGWPDDPLIIEEGSVKLTALGIALTLDEIYGYAS